MKLDEIVLVEKFKKMIINNFGSKGENWLSALPTINLAATWAKKDDEIYNWAIKFAELIK